MTVEFSPTESPFKQDLLIVDQNLKHEMTRQHKPFKTNKSNLSANEPAVVSRKSSNSHRTNTHNKPVKTNDCIEPNAQSPSHFERHFYSFLLNFITYAVLFVCAAKKLTLRLAYFGRIQFEQIHSAVKNSLKQDQCDKRDDDVDESFLIKQQRQISIDSNKQEALSTPKHVCVVLNEQIESADSLYETLRSVADYFASFSQVEQVTFYQFNPFANEIKERISNDFKHSDANNNHLVINSIGKQVSINDDLKNRAQRGSSKSHVTTFETKSKFELSFLHYENAGRCVLVDACKNIAKRVKSEQLRVEEITQDLVDTQILGS